MSRHNPLLPRPLPSVSGPERGSRGYTTGHTGSRLEVDLDIEYDKAGHHERHVRGRNNKLTNQPLDTGTPPFACSSICMPLLV